MSVLERGLTGLARLGKGKSVKDLSALDKNKEYPPQAADYEILDDCGRGVSATVHRAMCKPLHEIVAIKKMNLDSLNCNLDEIIHEAQTMKNYHHLNVLPLYTSFVHGSDLWMVMPFIAGGSVLHIMKYAHPDGLDEVAIATIMRDVLKALEYVHKQGGIHRDIKAGNILLDRDGHVFLADFGVAANTERTGSWGHEAVVRKTFVGTPCWMAPEVMEESQGYDSSADIWSFGITLLEMAHGHAPFAKFPPMKVLLMTLHNPPPQLDDKGKKHFSKSMRDLVTRCLQKDPRLRPTATQLLEHKFFKQAKDDEFLARYLIQGLPPLGDRVQDIRQGKAATNAQDNDANFARSQDEYIKGISTWNFDVAALKAAAANEPDEDEPMLPTITETDETTEGTLSGLVASQAAAFVRAQANGSNTTIPSPPPAPSNNNSVFASFQGQQQLLLNSSMSSLPVAVGGEPVATPTLSGGPPPTLPPVGDTITLSAGAEAKTPTHPTQPPPTQGTDSGFVSPGNLSPSGLSREGSVQGPLTALTASTTPTANKQKMKQQGRFQIYEPGSEPPPMSPPHPASAPDLATTSRPQTISLSDAARTSEDGARRIEPLNAQESSIFDDTITSTGEPKKKGRFLVVEQQSLSKVGSQASLVPMSRSEAGKDTGSTLGKPPTAPIASSGGASVSVAAVLPRLMEILEHATAHQQGIQRLVAAVQDTERGKTSPLLNRSVSTRALFSEYGAPLTPGPRVTGDGSGDSAELDAARQRIAELEAEVARLRVRNQQVESQLLALSGEGSHRVAHTPGGGSDTPGSITGGGAQGLSPSDGPSPRDRVEDTQ